MRAQGERGVGRGRTRAPPRVRFEPEVGDAPDGRTPWVRERERGENGSWAGARELGRERGFGPWEKEEKERKIGPVWAAGKIRKRKREIELGWKEREEERFSIFL